MVPFMRNYFGRRALPDCFARVAIDAHDDKLVVVRRSCDAETTSTTSESSASLPAEAAAFLAAAALAGLTITALALATAIVVALREQLVGRVGNLPNRWVASVRRAFGRLGRSFGFDGRQNEDAIAPDDRRRATATRDRHLPLDVLGLAPFDGRTSHRRDAGVLWPAELVPVLKFLALKILGPNRARDQAHEHAAGRLFQHS
jgi:hypothetical protein